MAKDQREKKAKIRIFFAEVEGGDETIQNGLQSLALALSRVVQPPVQPRPKPLPASLPQTREEEPNLFNQPIDEEDMGEDEGDSTESFDPPPQRNKPARPRKGRSYTVIPDLDLRPNGQISLIGFYQEKAPADQQEQIAVFIYYLSRMAKVTAVTDRHLYTCYKDVNEKVPPNILQVVRNTSSRKGWVDSSNSQNLRLTVNGENYVEHDLPNSKEASK